MWLRVTLLVAIAVWSFVIAYRREQQVLRRLTKAARGSVRRALGAITGYYLGLVAVLAVCGLVGAIFYDAGLPAVTTLVLLAALTITAPFLWFVAPSTTGGTGSATSFRDLRRLGANKKVARAIAYPAVVYHLLLLTPAIFGTATAVVLIG